MSFVDVIERTQGEGTARFWTVIRIGGPDGRVSRFSPQPDDGIVDFTDRRALLRHTAGRRGAIGRALTSILGPPQTVIMFCDGTRFASTTEAADRWINLTGPVRWPDEYPRDPIGLRFLDLARPETISHERVVGEEQVRDVTTKHYDLVLDTDQIVWPDPPPLPAGWVARRGMRFADPRPRGRLPAQAWVDAEGRVRRFSYAWRSRGERTQPARDKQLWPTTELWDFGDPDPLLPLESQPVIDPARLTRALIP